MYEAIRDEKLRLVGGDGVERAVTRPEDVNLGSDTVRLGRQLAAEPTPSGGGDSAIAMVSGTLGPPATTGPDSAADATIRDVQVGFTITTSLTERTKRDAMWSLFNQLARQVDDGKAQHVQLTIKATVPKPEGESLADKAREAGASPSTTEL